MKEDCGYAKMAALSKEDFLDAPGEDEEEGDNHDIWNTNTFRFIWDNRKYCFIKIKILY